MVRGWAAGGKWGLECSASAHAGDPAAVMEHGAELFRAGDARRVRADGGVPAPGPVLAPEVAARDEGEAGELVEGPEVVEEGAHVVGSLKEGRFATEITEQRGES